MSDAALGEICKKPHASLTGGYKRLPCSTRNV